MDESRADRDDSLADSATSSNSSIIFISSLMGFFPFSINLPYPVTKAAQDQFARLLAAEFHQLSTASSTASHPVHVNSVRPGWVRTPIIEHSGVVGGRYTAACVFKIFDLLTPLKRCGEADEIGRYVAQLAGTSARHINGQNLLIDGGQALPYCSVFRCSVM